MSSDAGLHDIADICFTARALAQSHPMTETARRYRRVCFEQQRADQPLPEFADWATTALDVGYCLRRTEEDLTSTTVQLVDMQPESLSTATGAVSERLRAGDPSLVTLLPADTTLGALDRLIAGELDKRADNVREQLPESDWNDLEIYIAWWVIHGYSLRAAEAGAAMAPRRPGGTPRILVIGVGNVLHGDDGFGVEVARRLEKASLPEGVAVAETGIGGIHLVHELMAGYDALIVIDAIDRGRPPGTVMVIEADVIDVEPLPVEQRHDLLADMHLATPERALMVAKAVGVLPDRTLIVGCQPVEVETLGIGLTDEVSKAVNVATDMILEEIEGFRTLLIDEGTSAAAGGEVKAASGG